MLQADSLVWTLPWHPDVPQEEFHSFFKAWGSSKHHKHTMGLREMQAACTGFVVRTQGSGRSLPSMVTTSSAPPAWLPSHPALKLLTKTATAFSARQKSPSHPRRGSCHRDREALALRGAWVGVANSIQDRGTAGKHPKQNLANAFASLSHIHIQRIPLFLTPSWKQVKTPV